MHFSIPDTQSVTEENNSIYTAFNLHINGSFHCSVRYRQLHNLHQQLCKELGASTLPSFPPKKLLTLTPLQVEERRISLEKYILQLSQDSRVLSNDVFNGWLVWAQNETQQMGERIEDVQVEVFLMNGQKISMKVSPTLQTNDLLERVCRHIKLFSQFVYYFALFLIKKEGKELVVVKKLQDFESPYLSQKCSKVPLKIVLRKNYWELKDEILLSTDKVALNLIYTQTVAEVEKNWLISTSDVLRQLAALQSRGAKKEYLELARSLKYYGYVQFEPCTCDFPQPNTPVLIAAGNRELNFRISCDDGTYKEGNFKVTRMKCWRISTNKYIGTVGQKSSVNPDKRDDSCCLELSFEYLMNRDEMRWIKVSSPQAVLMSLALQGMVQQLLSSKKGTSALLAKDRVRKGSLSFMRRDGSSTKVILNHTGEPLSKNEGSSSPLGELSWRRLSERLSDFSSHGGDSLQGDVVENNAFNVIGDENL